MKFDFSIPMTSYEMLAVVLSIIAILIPIIQMVWKKWIIQEKLQTSSQRVLHSSTLIKVGLICA